MSDRSPLRKGISAVGFLFSFLTTVPLIVVGITIIAQLHFGWRAILLFLMMAVASWAILVYYSVNDVNVSIDDLVRFKTDFPDLQLTRIPLADYIQELKARVPGLQSRRDDQILPRSATWQSGRLRLFVRSRQSTRLGPLPSQLVTYASAVGAWIILKDTPDRLSGIGYFTLFHEIGHTALLSLVARMGANTAVRYMLIPGLFIGLVIAPTWTQAIALLALTGAWYGAAVANRRSLRAHARVYDEIAADCFALERCDPAWFGSYSAARIVEMFSQAERGAESLPDSEVQERTKALTENLERVRQGRPLRTMRELQPGSKWQIVEEVLLITLLIGCGLAYAPLSLVRLSVLGAATFLVLCLSAVTLLYSRLAEHFADDCFGVRQMDPGELSILTRAATLRQRRKVQKVQRSRD